LFDLGKVILDFDFTPAFKGLSKVCGLSPIEIEAFFVTSGLEVLYDGGKISTADFYKEVRRGLKHSLSFSEFKKVWNDIFTPKPEMTRLVERLSPRYRMVLISNTNPMHFQHIRSRFPVIKRFDRAILSFEEKIRKPDARIYRKAIRACLADPQEIFYIDDRDDLTSAVEEMGLRTFTFKNNPANLVRKLRSLKIGVL